MGWPIDRQLNPVGAGRKYAQDGTIDSSTDNWWRNEIGSIKINPSDAYEWCGIITEGSTRDEDRDCYYANVPRVLRFNDYADRTLKKMCDHNSHKWDEDCINANDKVAVGNCDINSKCYNNQKNECKNSNIITTDLRCKDWCIEYL